MKANTQPGLLDKLKNTIYGDVKEMVPDDAPKPLGRPVVTTAYVDANLYHNTGRSRTSVLHVLNQTLINWYSKRQATVPAQTGQRGVVRFTPKQGYHNV